MNPPRARVIQQRLDKHFIEAVEVSVATPEPAWWWERYQDLGSLAILGWSYPMPNFEFGEGKSGVNPILVPYCPEIIDQQTADLSDEELGSYLDIIEYVCDTFIIGWFDFESPEEHVSNIILNMDLEFPDSYMFFQERIAHAKKMYGME